MQATAVCESSGAVQGRRRWRALGHRPRRPVPVQGVPWFALAFMSAVTAVRLELFWAPVRQTEEHLSELWHHLCAVRTPQVQEGEPVAG